MYELKMQIQFFFEAYKRAFYIYLLISDERSLCGYVVK